MHNYKSSRDRGGLIPLPLGFLPYHQVNYNEAQEVTKLGSDMRVAYQFGLKPEPKKIKTKAGQMNINIKTDEKKVHPLFRKEEEKREEEQEAKEEPKHDVKTAQQLTEQQAAAIYTGDSVAGIFTMMFNILHSRFPECSPLTTQEQKALGEAWYPHLRH